MADTADVERALVALCANVLFPNGGYIYNAASPSAVLVAPPTSPSGALVPLTCRLYRGWPGSDTLNADLASGYAHVSVYPEAGGGRNTTRFFTKWWQTPRQAPSLTAAVTQGSTTATVIWGGTAASGQLAGVALGAGAAPATFAYAVQPADTPASIAADFAAQIPGATANGVVLTVPSPNCLARVVQGAVATWLARQVSQRYRINLWCPSPHARDTLACALDTVLARTFRLALPDRTPALLRYGGTFVSDFPARQGEWNRALALQIDYSTAAIENLAAVLFPTGSINGAGFIAPISAAPELPPLIYVDSTNQILVDLGGHPLGGTGLINAGTIVPPQEVFVTTTGAVLVDVFGNPLVQA